VRRVRLTYFINSLEQGGAERQLAELICGVDQDLYEPSLVVCIARDQLGYRLPVERVHCLDAPMFPSFASVQHLSSLLGRLETELLHTTMGWENVFGRVAARMARVPAVVSSVRCTELPRKHVLGERFTHRMADAIIVNSTGIRDELARRAGVEAGRIDVIENGVDLERFAPLEGEALARERRFWGMNGRRVLVVPGRICAQKNQRGVLRALADMQRRRTLPADAKIVFAGRGSPPVYAEALRTYAALVGLGAFVDFLGVVGPIERLVGAADGVLLASRWEGLPNAVVEGMACGVPVVVSPAANVDGLVEDGREGVVCEGTDAATIARALERFFALPPADRAAMGRAGRAHATRRFAVRRMIEQTSAVYERVLSRRAAPLRKTSAKDALRSAAG
jgi:glycosyltransferase involved in cell wall biosynthesis